MAPGKPESALSKARELVNVSKQLVAIEVLCECMKVQKKQKAWVKTHEEVMMLLAELCVECKRSLQFKETIHQYKNMTFQMNPKSLEDVVKYYLSIAKKRTEEAREKSQQLVSDIEDLDNPETPENLILNAVNIEDEQDRQDRAILTPWLKFLWESYRQCLELLRNNVKFERLYHDIAQEAYEFCRKYDRKTEFRKLCDILRMHMVKYQNNLVVPATTPQTTAETWVYHLETRLKQLDHALKFELYNEAFKAVEDVWNLLSSSNISAKPRIYANYYSKTATVFFESGTSCLFHAAALHRLFFYSKENKKNMSTAELEALATRMAVATLAVPLPNNRDTVDPLLESGEITNPVKQKTLSMLLHLPSPPTRAKLIKEIENNRVCDLVNPELRDLFNVLEFDYKPLSMAKEAAPALAWLEEVPELRVYGPLIKEVIVSKTLIQVGKVYKTIRVEKFEKLCPYVDGLKLQTIVINLIRNLELPIRLDHRLQVLKFDVYTDLGISQRNDCNLVSEEINGISSLARQLSKFSTAIYEVADFIGYVDRERRENREWICQSYQRTVSESHQLIVNRKSAIETRKEEIELRDEELRQKAKEQKSQIQEKRKREECVRLREENEQMERKKIEDERAIQQKKITKAKINYLKSSDAGNQVLKNFSEKELEEMDEVRLAKMQIDEKIRMKEEEDERLKKLLQKVDHFQRALRLEEISAIQTAQLENFQRAQKMFEEKERIRAEEARIVHNEKLKNKGLCLSIESDIKSFIRSLESGSNESYEQELQQWEDECCKIKNAYKERRVAELIELKQQEEERTQRLEEERQLQEEKKLQEERAVDLERKAAEISQSTFVKSAPLPNSSAVDGGASGKYVPPFLRNKGGSVNKAPVAASASADRKSPDTTELWTKVGKKQK